MPSKNSKKQKGGHCPKHLNAVKSILVGATEIPHKTTQKGGDGLGRTKTIGVTPYHRYNNGGSDRQAAMKVTQDANAAQQKAIDHSGGRQKEKLGKLRNINEKKLEVRNQRKAKNIKKDTIKKEN